MKTRWANGWISVLLLAAGCVALGPTVRPDSRVREHAVREQELQDMRTALRLLQERVEALATAQEELARSVESLRESVRREGATVQSRLLEIEAGVRSADAARQQLRAEIIDDLSRKIARLHTVQVPISSPRSSGGTQEHVVQPGETLSKIAATYRVSVTALAEANGLKNPDALRPGQKLVIPAGASGGR